MKKMQILICFFLSIGAVVWGKTDPPRTKPQAKVEKVKIMYKGKMVNARKLTVSSAIPMPVDSAWSKIRQSQLLEFVTKGKIKFKPTEGRFPETWIEHDTVSTRMKLYGFLPFGGVHSLCFHKIDAENKIMETREWDKTTKVWDHTIRMQAQSTDLTYYEDEIIIYGGTLTGIITAFAKNFYKHRQKRWQLVARGAL